MMCEFIKIDNHYQCKKCGFKVFGVDGPEIHRVCDEEALSLGDKFINLTKDIVKWVSNGAPINTQEETNRRLNICSSCQFFNNGTCSKCGCNLSIKAELSTTRCPIDKW